MLLNVDKYNPEVCFLCEGCQGHQLGELTNLGLHNEPLVLPGSH